MLDAHPQHSRIWLACSSHLQRHWLTSPNCVSSAELSYCEDFLTCCLPDEENYIRHGFASHIFFAEKEITLSATKICGRILWRRLFETFQVSLVFTSLLMVSISTNCKIGGISSDSQSKSSLFFFLNQASTLSKAILHLLTISNHPSVL